MPIPHFALVERLREIVVNAGLSITQEAHALARNGLRYFGLFQVAGIPNFSQESNIGTVIGLRNSHDKSFPAGINAGSAPFVCDNLAFSGEVRVSRKHTRFVLRDLPGLSSELIAKLAEAGVHSRDDLADLATDELTEITGQSAEEATALIMKAREHWFSSQA